MWKPEHPEENQNLNNWFFHINQIQKLIISKLTVWIGKCSSGRTLKEHPHWAYLGLFVFWTRTFGNFKLLSEDGKSKIGKIRSKVQRGSVLMLLYVLQQSHKNILSFWYFMNRMNLSFAFCLRILIIHRNEGHHCILQFHNICKLNRIWACNNFRVLT